MRIRILGSLDVTDLDGRSVTVGGRKQRTLLAALLLDANRIVPISRLIAALWEDSPPESARHSVHLLVHRLRRSLGDGQTGAVLLTQGPAYLLELPAGQLDAEVFERLVGDAQAATAAGRHVEGVERYDQALSLWRGPPLADLHDAPFAQPAIARLEGLHATAVAGRAEAALALGQHTQLVPALGELVRRYPLQERLYRLLILALYRSGRQAEALATYRAARDALVERLGIEPSEELRQLQQAILTHDVTLTAAAPEAAPAATARPSAHDGTATGAAAPDATVAGVTVTVERRLVTVLVAELPTTTRAGGDPEDLWAQRTSVVEPVRQQVERYGGVLDAEVGGILSAAFGARRTRTDDPERAVRAALGIRQALGGRHVALVRIGIDTGEAVVAQPSDPHAAPEITGEVVHGALALATAAAPGGVLVGEATREATRHAVGYRPVGGAAGQSGPAAPCGWLAVAARPPGADADGPDRAATPVIGRERELALLGGLLDQLRHVPEPQLVTVVGPAGIGKTRLLEELRRRGGHGEDAPAWLVGRCPPYGGDATVTFRPLTEIVRAGLGIPAAGGAEAAERRLDTAVGRLLDGDRDAARVAAGIRPLALPHLPHAAEDLAGHDCETFPAWRAFFEAAGRAHPLVLVFEDLHWADDALLDFIEHLARDAQDVPLLIACLAWPELLERRPGWGGGQHHAATFMLQPLTRTHTRRLLERKLGGLVPPGRHLEQVLAGAAGNPRFVGEYARMLRDPRTPRRDAWADLPPPPAVQGMTAARLDCLDPADRALLAAAAVFGQTVWVGALAEVSGRAPDEVGAAMRRAARQGILRRARRPSVPGDVEYAFRDPLVREAAYGRMLRGDRAERHRRAARWLEQHLPARAEPAAHHHRQALPPAAAGEPTPRDLSLPAVRRAP